MVLADWEIVRALLDGTLVITPMIDSELQIGASSVDVRLGTEFRIIRTMKQTHFDLQLPKEEVRRQVRRYTEVVHVSPRHPFVLHPNEFALGSTLEYIRLPKTLAARIEGRSTWGRVGLQIHSTAGYVDPGFEGILTFELHNLGKLPLPLYPGVRIAQLSFHRCEEVCVGYTDKGTSKYAKSIAAADTLFYEDYEYDVILEMLRQSRSSQAGPSGP